jgi:hypothetical protein
VVDSDGVVEEMWDQYVKAETRSVVVLVVLAEEVLLAEVDSAHVDGCEVERLHSAIVGMASVVAALEQEKNILAAGKDFAEQGSAFDTGWRVVLGTDTLVLAGVKKQSCNLNLHLA